jgi:hypothetical protein
MPARRPGAQQQADTLIVLFFGGVEKNTGISNPLSSQGCREAKRIVKQPQRRKDVRGNNICTVKSVGGSTFLLNNGDTHGSTLEH